MVTLAAVGEGRMEGHVLSVRYLGATKRVTVAVPDLEIAALVAADRPVPVPGEGVSLTWAHGGAARNG